MSPPSLVCLSLTTNLRCVGFTQAQFVALIIPPAIEAIISLCFIYLYSGPTRLTQVFLVVDSISYFVWALLDMLSRVLPAARASFSIFQALDVLIGAVSFTPILLYSIYLYRLSFRHFIPTLPRKLQPYLEIFLPISVVVTVAMNEVSSFVGIHLGTASNQPLVQFPHDDESLWLSLSRSTLTIYTTVQFLFFLLSFSRLSRVFLDQRRTEITRSDEQYYFNGTPWITAGVIIGVMETIAGFTMVSFGVALARRILRLIARTTLMFGLLKGLDESENFENLVDELRGVSQVSRRISRMLGVSPPRNIFRRISQSPSEQSRANDRPAAEKRSAKQRVTVHYEEGQAPFLQIRFSALDFPAQAVLADTVQQRRRSLSGSIPAFAGAGTSTQRGDKDLSDETAASRDDKRRVKLEVVASSNHHHVGPDSDWIRPPERIRERQGSGGNISDSQSIVKDLERRFPNLPPRVTGKYRGSILGENLEDDPFPIVGVSRQSSLLQAGNAQDPSEEGEATVAVTLSSNSSIRRKPAPPLLDHITYISERRNRPTSTWGGLTTGPPMASNSPSQGTMAYSSDATLAGEPSTPKSRRSARNVLKRASRALSDASIRSAEWLASASSPRSTRTPLTASDIEMYRRGTLGPRSTHLTPGVDDGSAGENLLPKASRKSADDIRIYSKPPNQPRISVGL